MGSNQPNVDDEIVLKPNNSKNRDRDLSEYKKEAPQEDIYLNVDKPSKKK
jgi:hypothetical protein